MWVGHPCPTPLPLPLQLQLQLQLLLLFRGPTPDPAPQNYFINVAWLDAHSHPLPSFTHVSVNLP